MLKNSKFTVFTLAEVLFHPAEQSRRIAFTLAEVLITLTIIGIVAALTMPALIQHYKKQEASVKLKKFYSMLNQAVKMSEIDNGEVENWTHNRSLVVNQNNGNKYNEESNKEEVKRFYNTYLKNYIKSISGADAELTPDVEVGRASYKVILADGTCFYLRNGACFDIIYDYNGDKLPNKFGRDQFVLLICPAIPNSLSFFAPNGFDKKRSRDDSITMCKNNAYNCSQLLFRDNWEFKSDYPYKL